MNLFNTKNTVRFSLTLGAAALLSLALVAPSHAQAIRAGYDSSTLAANDDGSTGLVPLGFTLDFFGNSYSNVYVNNNGNVTFNGPLGTYTPSGLTGPTGLRTIAPFWADVDTRGIGSGVTQYGQGLYNVSPGVDLPAFGVSWRNVGYYNGQTNKLNSFQLILVNRTDISATSWDMEFNYDKIQWETGSDSGGINGLGGTSARAGFSAGTGAPGSFYEFGGSGVNGAFLDSNLATGLKYNSLNSSQPGRYTFRVNGGTPAVIASAPEPGTLALLALGGAPVLLKRRRK